MSKLLTGLMDAERKRRQLAASTPLPPVGGNTVANGDAGSWMVADSTGQVDEEQAALALRSHIEQEFAPAQAAAAQLEADRSAAALLDGRIERESAALAKAQREERRAAELAAAAAVRAAKEAELARLTMERAAAERCAADRAAAQLQADRAAEAAARSRVTAEEDVRQQTRRRVEQEAEVSRAAAQSARDRVPGREANPTVNPAVVGSVAVASREADQRDRGQPVAFGRVVVVAALAMGIGLSAGFWLAGSAQVPPTPPVSVGNPPAAADRDAPYLRLDHELRAVPGGTPRSLSAKP